MNDSINMPWATNIFYHFNIKIQLVVVVVVNYFEVDDINGFHKQKYSQNFYESKVPENTFKEMYISRLTEFG